MSSFIFVLLVRFFIMIIITIRLNRYGDYPHYVFLTFSLKINLGHIYNKLKTFQQYLKVNMF